VWTLQNFTPVYAEAAAQMAGKVRFAEAELR